MIIASPSRMNSSAKNGIVTPASGAEAREEGHRPQDDPEPAHRHAVRDAQRVEADHRRPSPRDDGELGQILEAEAADHDEEEPPPRRVEPGGEWPTCAPIVRPISLLSSS